MTTTIASDYEALSSHDLLWMLTRTRAAFSNGNQTPHEREIERECLHVLCHRYNEDTVLGALIRGGQIILAYTHFANS